MSAIKTADWIRDGRAILGIEFGSTRIKAVLIGEKHEPVASGDYLWENKLENGVWTYHLEDVWTGLQSAYTMLKKNVLEQYGVKLHGAAAIGISGMMHGYLAFDAHGRLLAPFRTWRNTITGEAARELTDLFRFNIPQRWSVAHLYQAMKNKETHVNAIAHFTTLAGYVHWQLTGERVLGVGEASGMFPIDSVTCSYDAAMLEAFEQKTGWNLCGLLPRVAKAGEAAGVLTKEGALLLDPTGELESGIPFCPPEGDAGTGMVATNSVSVRTGNVSAGTSVFAMIVLEKPLSKVYPEIDMVTTPTGKPVAMVHCNNCTSDINAWAGVLKGFADALHIEVSMKDIYTALFTSAMDGDKDCGGIVNLPMFSGEPVLGLEEGRPMMVRIPDAKMTFSNFARSLACGAMAGLKIGMEILRKEQVRIDSLLGHGGYFKTPKAGQKLLAAALGTPVSVMETAGEGGPWGMALLAAYRVNAKPGQTLERYLTEEVFVHANACEEKPDAEDVEGFENYTLQFMQALKAEMAADALNGN